MATGAFAPLPLRLTADTLSAIQWLRLCADVVAAKQSAPIAVLRVGQQGAGTRPINWYSGQNGYGADYAPTVGTLANYEFSLTWTATFENELGEAIPWNIVAAQAFAGGGGAVNGCQAIAVLQYPNAITVSTRNATSGVAADDDATILIYGGQSGDVEDYGGASDKENNTTEIVPYAAQFYRQIQGLLGSAYSQELSGLVHVENLVDARQWAWLRRLIEKLSCEMNPGTASGRLASWCTLLAVPWRYGEAESVLRGRCVASMRRFRGPSPQVVDDALSSLLGGWYVKSWRQWSDVLDPPPALTYWPVANPGPNAWDIGGGCWMSERCHLVVEVLMPAQADLGEFLTRMNVDMFQLLDKMLPAHWTFNWAVGVDDGFTLDIDQLDFGCLTD